ncbi:hypothetical protein SCHPADRAFT_897038 [Schizopora paradoxa]|uniref:Uncharacterized protein n=1 Tax=Schizopora paradoxa TaxID=27342 RepID=A0A0H2QZM5_9AGAM|nr:hypothetical protein SCHPADRAFT_897038 [Schizopora paradoxa]
MATSRRAGVTHQRVDRSPLIFGRFRLETAALDLQRGSSASQLRDVTAIRQLFDNSIVASSSYVPDAEVSLCKSHIDLKPTSTRYRELASCLAALRCAASLAATTLIDGARYGIIYEARRPFVDIAKQNIWPPVPSLQMREYRKAAEGSELSMHRRHISEGRRRPKNLSTIHFESARATQAGETDGELAATSSTLTVWIESSRSGVRDWRQRRAIRRAGGSRVGRAGRVCMRSTLSSSAPPLILARRMNTIELREWDVTTRRLRQGKTIVDGAYRKCAVMQRLRLTHPAAQNNADGTYRQLATGRVKRTVQYCCVAVNTYGGALCARNWCDGQSCGFSLPPSQCVDVFGAVLTYRHLAVAAAAESVDDIERKLPTWRIDLLRTVPLSLPRLQSSSSEWHAGTSYFESRGPIERKQPQCTRFEGTFPFSTFAVYIESSRHVLPIGAILDVVPLRNGTQASTLYIKSSRRKRSMHVIRDDVTSNSPEHEKMAYFESSRRRSTSKALDTSIPNFKLMVHNDSSRRAEFIVYAMTVHIESSGHGHANRLRYISIRGEANLRLEALTNSPPLTHSPPKSLAWWKTSKRGCQRVRTSLERGLRNRSREDVVVAGTVVLAGPWRGNLCSDDSWRTQEGTAYATYVLLL